MSEPAALDERVTRLENEMAEVRILAVNADREASDNTATLRGQVGILNSIGETQREHGLKLAQHGKRLDRLEKKVDAGFAEMRQGFAQVDENFAKVETKFAKVHDGLDKITALLTDEPDET